MASRRPVSLRDMRVSVAGSVLCQSNVETDTRIITATQRGHRDAGDEADDECQQEFAGAERGDPRQRAGGADVDRYYEEHGLLTPQMKPLGFTVQEMQMRSRGR